MRKFTFQNLRSDVNPSKRKGRHRNLKLPYDEHRYDGSDTDAIEVE